MKKKAGKRRILAVFLAVLMIFTALPGYVSVQGEPGDEIGAELSPVLDGKEGTDDGSIEETEGTLPEKMFGDEENSEGESPPIQNDIKDADSSQDEDGEEAAQLCQVILDLDGGQINGLVNEGWTKDETAASKWARSVEAGTALILSEPYRAGYEFQGWRIGEGTEPVKESIVAEGETMMVTAVWKEALYSVSFLNAGETEPLWSLELPYGSTLWTDSQTAPWEKVEDWTESKPGEETAEVKFETEDETVTVTRHHQEEDRYYYTFTLAEVKYFTYGGQVPVKAGSHFTEWKMTSGGSGFTVTEDTVFTAQYKAGKSYTFYTYYQYDDNTKVEDVPTASVTLSEQDIENDILRFEILVPSLSHYTGILLDQKLSGVTVGQSEGTEEGLSYEIQVDTKVAFEENTANNYLAFTVQYTPAEISYTVEYYQQIVEPENGYTGEDGDYTLVGSLEGQGKYNSVIPIEDRPQLAGKDFDGFMVSDRSMAMVQGGVLLDETVVAETEEQAAIKIYYDRASYYIYTLTDTTEVTVAPVKVQYGAKIPEINQKITRAGYRFTGYQWYCLGEDGSLDLYENGVIGEQAVMPAYDLYAVAQWEKAETDLRILYWVEARNAATYQNAFTYEISNVPTGQKVTVTELDSENPGLTAEGGDWDENLRGKIQEGFRQLIEQRYGNTSYTQYFSYNSEQTKASPGNVESAEETNTGNVQDGKIAGDSFGVEVKGDGSTTINVYYSRNLYTIEFVLGYKASNGKTQVATATDEGTFDGANWNGDNGQVGEILFENFPSGRITESWADSDYGEMKVEKEYRITESIGRDSRAAVGRYGTRTIKSSSKGNVIAWVYRLTARFEADISMLWPTKENIQVGGSTNLAYVSMSPDKSSYYRKVTAAESGQKNILGTYSTMDHAITSMSVNGKIYQSQQDTGNGEVAHQLISYWNRGSYFDYYFLYETLDTTKTAGDRGIEEFNVDIADSSIKGTGNWWQEKYEEGDLVSYQGKVYVFTKERVQQVSTNVASGQNQPAKQGYESVGREYAVEGNSPGAAVNAPMRDRVNIFFFYSRETYSLNITNVNGSYIPDEQLLYYRFSSLSYYPEGGTQEEVKYNISLAELGWEEIDQNGNIRLRYNAALSAINEKAVQDWLVSGEDNSVPLRYPYESMGENQYYFDGWFRNQAGTVRFDWTSNEMHQMTGNVTVYAGWFTPRYATSYKLNGGTWTDEIEKTVMSATLNGKTIFLCYPHMAGDGQSDLYWYEMTKEDRLYIDKLYRSTLERIMEQGEDGHWHLRSSMNSIDALIEVSTEEEQTDLMTNRYACYMQYTDGQTDLSASHQYYVTVNQEVASVLSKPENPVRNGYAFSGWYWFEEEQEESEKVYLSSVIGNNQSITSYGDGYVYLDSVDDAHLLYQDENGDLYYYADQTGYRFSYEHQASIVDRDRVLYAAWKSTNDAKAEIYHLVKEADAEQITEMTPDEGETISLENAEKITINNAVYLKLSEEERNGLYTGTSQKVTAKEYFTDNQSRTWLPTLAYQNLSISDRTPEGKKTGESIAFQGDGQSYRLKREDGGYDYYAYFIYEPTDEVQYQVYAIDLSVAVAEGALESYSDTFSRDAKIPENAGYLIQPPASKSWKLDKDIASAVVTENAPQINGYTVYQDWTQTLQLQSRQGTNQIFFYYVKDGTLINYSITYYLMTDGKYTPEHTISLTDIPAVTGELLKVDNMLESYQELVTTAGKMNGYAESENEGQKELYQRYAEMKISYQEGDQKLEYTVQAKDQDTLDLDTAAALTEDYAMDSWSPSGNTLVLSDGAHIDVYLQNARMKIQKLDEKGNPLQGAEFTLERLLPVPESGEALESAEKVEYEGKQYYVDQSFEKLSARSDAAGEVMFYNLSAKEGGLYRLREEQAPNGYGQLYEPVYLKVPYELDGKTYYIVTYTVQNSGVDWMPKAGVFGGIYRTLLPGGAILAAGAVLLAERQNRRRGKKKKIVQ